ncbi:hypothetical protein SLEP1_g25328 [Rubroshorea leprosula]|uniref:Uncharacterized protein n=1 Tax=Rubroshorea leprosula TaxID=152421 RepID=A0AAV5JUM8_9ROSI|nr:hypothetical protein SLEP1_g25328 [Rubroshorea leprosula]
MRVRTGGRGWSQSFQFAVSTCRFPVPIASPTYSAARIPAMSSPESRRNVRRSSIPQLSSRNPQSPVSLKTRGTSSADSTTSLDFTPNRSTNRLEKSRLHGF